MRFSFSNKLFVGFSLLSLLTILLGVTTVAIIKEITSSQKNITLLQEFELRIDALAAATNAQSNVAFISTRSYEDFLANLDRTKQVAEKILHSDYCPSTPSQGETDSCQSIILEAMDFYPRAAVAHYEKTLLTLRLITKNHFIYRKMLEAIALLPEKGDNHRVSNIVNQLEMLKHEFEESNNVGAIEAMKRNSQLIEELARGTELSKLARIFIANSEQTYRNRLENLAAQEDLAETSKKFLAISRSLHEKMVEDRYMYNREVLGIVMFLGFCSILMTILFWLLTSRRISRFLTNQKEAINSIKTGRYDYPVEKDSDDELTELYLSTKDLANDLKEEIAEKKYSQQEKKDLQFQLMQAQRLESVGVLAGGIAHDFNNVLTGITGYTDLALARLEDNHPVKRYLETIAISGQKAGEMTRQLLAFSRKQETYKQVVNLNSLITNLMKMLDRMIGDDIVLEFHTAPDLPPVMADPTHIEHVLLNMAVNAKDAMPNGGKLTITTATAILDDTTVGRLEGVDPGNFVRISITDSGAGIPEEVRTKIFDPFFTTKANDQGTGLGLATAFGIIKQHNGYINVESTVGQGTTFNLYLPIIKADLTEETEQSEAGSRIAEGRETILLVDDNDTAREFICETLEYCGYKVLTAGSGSEAIKVMRQTDYAIDLLLTDIIMPGMNGTELAGKGRELYPNIKVLFMSGYDDLPADRELKSMSENHDFLKKPMSVEKLSRKVREILDR